MTNYEQLTELDTFAELLYDNCADSPDACDKSPLRIDGECPTGEFGGNREACLECIKIWLNKAIEEETSPESKQSYVREEEERMKEENVQEENVQEEIQEKKVNVVTVRWFDGYKEDFRCTEIRFGNAYLWMRLEDGKNRHIPLSQVRWFGTSVESHQDTGM